MSSPRLLIKAARSCLLLLVVLLPLNSAAIFPARAMVVYDAVFYSGFGNSYLNPIWTWENEDPGAWSLGYDPFTYTYDLKVLTQPAPLKNVLSLKAPDSYYSAKLDLEYVPSLDSQFAGLRLFEDVDNYVQIVVTRENGATRLAWQSRQNGINKETSTPFTQSRATLRLTRQGTTYIGEFIDINSNYTWKALGYITYSSPLSQVQLVTGETTTGEQEVAAHFMSFDMWYRLPSLSFSTQESFYEPALSARWTWLNEDPSRWRINASEGLVIQTPQTDGQTNVLLRSLPVGDFDLRIKMYFQPDANEQSAGLIIYDSEGDYLTLTKGFCNFLQDCQGIGVGFFFDQVRAGQPSGSRYHTDPSSDPSNYHFLRIIRQGNMYSAFVGRYDMVGSWELVGIHTLDDGFAPTHIGLKTNSRYQSPSIPATFAEYQLDTQFRDGSAIFLPALFKNIPAGNFGSTPVVEPTATPGYSNDTPEPEPTITPYAILR